MHQAGRRLERGHHSVSAPWYETLSPPLGVDLRGIKGTTPSTVGNNNGSEGKSQSEAAAKGKAKAKAKAKNKAAAKKAAAKASAA